jgi:hypothetical protein
MNKSGQGLNPNPFSDRCKSIALRIPCFAQAQGVHPWPPVERMRSTPGGFGQNVLFCTFRERYVDPTPTGDPPAPDRNSRSIRAAVVLLFGSTGISAASVATMRGGHSTGTTLGCTHGHDFSSLWPPLQNSRAKNRLSEIGILACEAREPPLASCHPSWARRKR